MAPKLQPFHLTATGYNINYLPEYIALRHGFFAEQGLDVTVNIPNPWDDVLVALADGSADMALGGIWVPTMYRDRVQDYTVFAQIANRCPLALLRRGGKGAEGFELSDVVGKTVLLKSGGGASCGLFFKMLLREYGIDHNSVDYIQDLQGQMLGELFEGGMGDFYCTDNLSALAMVARNPDVLIAMEMVTQGDVPWSVYYRETATITDQVLDAQKKFCVALEKGIEWVLKHDAESFKDELAELFPSVPIEVAVGVTNGFRQNKMWTSTSVAPGGFERWQFGLAGARLVKEPMAYDSIVDDGPASAAQQELAAAAKAGGVDRAQL
jgi:NitT/TauT family transport system substrate-binding protein